MFPGSSRDPDPWAPGAGLRAPQNGSSSTRSDVPRMVYLGGPASDQVSPYGEPRGAPPAFPDQPASTGGYSLPPPPPAPYQPGSRLPIPALPQEDRGFVSPFASSNPPSSSGQPPHAPMVGPSAISSAWNNHTTMSFNSPGPYSDYSERPRPILPAATSSSPHVADNASFLGGHDDFSRPRSQAQTQLLSGPSPSMYGRAPDYGDPMSDSFPVNGMTSHHDVNQVGGVNGGDGYADAAAKADGDGHASLGADGPMTVADIVSRPIIERRKRPIPQDPSRLVQLDAPVPPRRSKRVAANASHAAAARQMDGGASASQGAGAGGSGADGGKATSSTEADGQDAGLALQRGSKRKYKSSEQVDDAEAKRIRNTLAARRHRLYKAQQWKNMQDEVERLRARNAELEAQAASTQRPGEGMLVAENRSLVARIRQLEADRQDLLAQIEQMEHQMRRTRPHQGFY